MRLFVFIGSLLFFFHLSICAQVDGYSKRYYDDKDAIFKIFPKANTFSKVSVELTADSKKKIENKLRFQISDTKLVFYRVFSGEKLLGYSLVLNEKGKYKPITFMTGITPELKIKDVVVMVYREKIGSEVRKKRFLRQFRDKSQSDDLVVDKDISGISGATISTWSIATGVKRALVLIDHLI